MVTRGIEICFLSFLWAEIVKRAYCKNFLIPRNPRRIPGGFSTSRQRRLERQIRRHLWLDRILVAGFSPSLAEKAVPAARDAMWVVGTHYHSCTETQDRGKGEQPAHLQASVTGFTVARTLMIKVLCQKQNNMKTNTHLVFRGVVLGEFHWDVRRCFVSARPSPGSGLFYTSPLELTPRYTRHGCPGAVGFKEFIGCFYIYISGFAWIL